LNAVDAAVTSITCQKLDSFTAQILMIHVDFNSSRQFVLSPAIYDEDETYCVSALLYSYFKPSLYVSVLMCGVCEPRSVRLFLTTDKRTRILILLMSLRPQETEEGNTNQRRINMEVQYVMLPTVTLFLLCNNPFSFKSLFV